MVTVAIILLIAAIAIGLIRKTNIGPILFAFAIILGVSAAGMSVNEVLAGIPVSLIFKIAAVTMFYGFSRENGALQGFVSHIFRLFRRKPKLVPFAIFIVTLVISIMGLGIFSGMFIAPLGFELGKKAKSNSMLIFLCVCCGALAGSNLPFSLGGVVAQGLMISIGKVDPALASAYTLVGSALTVFVCLIMVVLGHLIFRSKSEEIIEEEELMSFSIRQKQTLVLIAVVTAAILMINILSTFRLISSNSLIAKIGDIGVICTIGIVIECVLGLGSEKKVVHDIVPWNVILLVSGFSSFLAVVQKLGVIDIVADKLIDLAGVSYIALILCVIAGLLSLVSSGLSVVCPLLFSIVAQVVLKTGADPTIMFAAVFAGASITAISPFSALGSSVLSCSPDENEQQLMFYKIIPLAFLMLVICAAASLLGHVLL